MYELEFEVFRVVA